MGHSTHPDRGICSGIGGNPDRPVGAAMEIPGQPRHPNRNCYSAGLVSAGKVLPGQFGWNGNGCRSL